MQIGYRATTLQAMSGVFLALFCALCFAGFFLGVELWHSRRQVRTSNAHFGSRHSSTSKTPKNNSKKRYVKLGICVPDDYQTSTVLRELELELLRRDERLRILLLDNGQEFYHDE